MTTVDLWQRLTIAATAVSATVAAVYALARLVKSLRRRWQPVEEFLSDWRGEPDRPGVPGRAGVMERLCTIESDGAEVRRQLEGHIAAHGRSVNGPVTDRESRERVK